MIFILWRKASIKTKVVLILMKEVIDGLESAKRGNVKMATGQQYNEEKTGINLNRPANIRTLLILTLNVASRPTITLTSTKSTMIMKM